MSGSVGTAGAVVLLVRDVQASSTWYRHVLRFHLEAECLGLNGVPVEARLWRPGGPTLVLRRSDLASPGAGRQQRPRLMLNDDLGRVVERAAAVADLAAWGPADQPARQARLLLYDPDGHTLVLLQTREALQ